MVEMTTTFGLKIKNFTAKSIVKFNKGEIDKYETTNGLFAKSLFYEYIYEDLKKIGKGKCATNDIISIDFSYTKNPESVRTEFYKNGVDITYNKEKIHYKFLFRSVGKAKEGSAVFIKKSLYKKADAFLKMGMELPNENIPLVQLGAYTSLIASTIDINIGEKGELRIEPENILVINDVTFPFKTNVISVETEQNDEKTKCVVKNISNYEVKNNLYDGQALIDKSIFPKEGNGYVLLRQHFTKMAAFCTDIKQFFMDYCAEHGFDYNTYAVSDMWGNEHKVCDIKLITTESAMKWLKFEKYGYDYEYWCKKVRENDCMFGIVKTAHKSKYDDDQRMSYQMVNTLDFDNEMKERIMSHTKLFVDKLKNDSDFFEDFLKSNATFSNDYEVLLYLCKNNLEFYKSEYYRERKTKIIEGFVDKIHTGKILQNADNLVIVGSPYAMLLSAAGEDILKFPELDVTFKEDRKSIQCYTERFDSGKYLAAFRNPFNSKNNMSYLHNVDHEYFHKYFDFGKQIIAVNMVGSDFQDRNNGADQDSDAIYTTDQEDIVACAKKCYEEYPTIVNNIEQEDKTYDNTPEVFAEIDDKIAAAKTITGESSNLAQLCLTYSYNFPEQKEKYENLLCILSVLAQIAIDNAKKNFKINLISETSRIRKEMDIPKYGYPSFWKQINIEKKASINNTLHCPMNEIAEYSFEAASHVKRIDMDYFFQKYSLDKKTFDNFKDSAKKIEKEIDEFKHKLFNFNANEKNNRDNDESYSLLNMDYEELKLELKDKNVTKGDIGKWLTSKIIDKAFHISEKTSSKKTTKDEKEERKQRVCVLKILYDINKENVLWCFSKNMTEKK